MSSHNNLTSKLSLAGVLITLGIIYGDIGTSPLYVMKSIVASSDHGPERITEELVYGGVSCVFWTLMILTTFKYVYLTLNADNRGEGGIFALYALVRRYKSKWIIYPAIIGCASLIADGFITPPISVASAIEGLQSIPGLENLHTVPIVISILVVLFIIQQFGTNFVGKAFGPIMIIWFGMLAYLGIHHIVQYPSVLKALNPMYAIHLVTNYTGELTHLHGFWLLGAVFLCTTGGEAMYSDLGHCGKQNIRISWIFVFICLIINYLGQGALLMSQYGGKTFEGTSVFYAMMDKDFLPIGIVIASSAAVIASQALISGCFTLVNEAMKLKLWPNMKVNYPTQLMGQIYIPGINWFLMIGCIAVVLIFRESGKMEAAYGLAIVFNMLMTTSLLLHYMHMKRFNWAYIVSVGVVLIIVEMAFMISNLSKFTHGGWFSVMLGAFLFFCIFMWYKAKLLRKQHLSFLDFEPYLPALKDLMHDDTIPKEATNLVYMAMAGDQRQIDANIVYSIFRKRPKKADIYWFVHVEISDDPFMKKYRVHTLVPGKVFFIKLRFGFKVEHKVNKMFSKIVADMQASGEVDELSHHPSLRKHNFGADFKFILLNSRVSADEEISPFNQFVVRVYRILKKLSLSTQEDFGLEIANVEMETVPISVGKSKDISLEREN